MGIKKQSSGYLTLSKVIKIMLLNSQNEQRNVLNNEKMNGKNLFSLQVKIVTVQKSYKNEIVKMSYKTE